MAQTALYNADIIVALSEDGGQTWGNLQWVDTLPANGREVDYPFVFSNPVAPYDTYVSWVTADGVNPPLGHLRKIQ